MAGEGVAEHVGMDGVVHALLDAELLQAHLHSAMANALAALGGEQSLFIILCVERARFQPIFECGKRVGTYGECAGFAAFTGDGEHGVAPVDIIDIQTHRFCQTQTRGIN